jgi:NAD(P)-dependent dehydrogenase (short-subunit alcohol dehydrogenase family)
MRLQDKVTIVTGAAGYIGRAYATRLGQEGARVVICDIADLTETAQAVQATGAEVLPLTVDVSSEASTREMACKAVDRFGRIDCLVNNAALFHGQGMEARLIEDVDLDAFDRTLAINIKGPFLCIRAVLPYMREQRGGKIVNIGSGTWLHTARGIKSTPHYVASKAAVTGLTRALAKELGRHNIRINTLAPGATPPEGREAALWGPQFEENERALGRFGLPEDMTGALVFLFSDDSDYMTGQMILINGGMETW